MRVYGQKSPIERFQSSKIFCIYCHSNALFPLVRLIMWLLKTNENTILLSRSIYILALEQLNGRFLYIIAQTIIMQDDFFTPQLLHDKRCFYERGIDKQRLVKYLCIIVCNEKCVQANLLQKLTKIYEKKNAKRQKLNCPHALNGSGATLEGVVLQILNGHFFCLYI